MNRRAPRGYGIFFAKNSQYGISSRSPRGLGTTIKAETLLDIQAYRRVLPTSITHLETSCLFLYSYLNSWYFFQPCMVFYFAIACWWVFSHQHDPTNNFTVLIVECDILHAKEQIQIDSLTKTGSKSEANATQSLKPSHKLFLVII